MKLSLGFSPCPNDTFIFDALVHIKVDTEGLEFDGPGPSKSLSGTDIGLTVLTSDLSIDGKACVVVKTLRGLSMSEPKHLKVGS